METTTNDDDEEEEVTIHCKRDGQKIQLSKQVANRAGFFKVMMEETEGNILPVELAAPPMCLVAAMLKHNATVAAGAGGNVTYSLVDVELEALTDATNAAHFLEATEVFVQLAKEIFRRMEGLDVYALRQILGVRDEEAAPETAHASLLAEPLFEPAGQAAPEGDAAANPEGGAPSSSTGAATPPPLSRTMSTSLGSEDAIYAALQHAPTALLRTLKAVSSSWKLRARRELCSRVCPLATRPLDAAGRPAPVPTRREDIHGIDAEFLICAGRPCDVVTAGQALPGLATLHGYGFQVDVSAARQADVEIDEEDYEESDEVLDSVLRLPALRACIIPEEGEVPRELLLATVALAVSNELPVNKLTGTELVECLDLSSKGLGFCSAVVIASLISVNASLTNLDLHGNSLKDEGVKVICEALQSSKETKLASLNVGYNDVGIVGAKAVAAMAAVVASLTSIDLSRNNLGAEGAKPLADALRVTASLTSLNLSLNKLGPDGATTLAPAIAANRSLTELNLYRNKVKDEGVTAICEAVQSNKETKLASLNVGMNEIGPAGAKSVAAMVAVIPSLTECKLRSNNLGIKGWTEIFNALLNSPTSKITTWDLSYENLGPEIAKPLAEYLSVTPSLTSLDVRFNDISGDGASQLSSAVLGNTKIEVFNEVPIKEMRADSFTELNLKGKDIGVEGGMVVAGLLPVMASLTSLNLAQNNLGGETLHVQANKVQGSSFNVGDEVIYEGRKMVVSKGKDMHGYIKMKPVDWMLGINAIADALRVNTSLTSLSLGDNNLGDDGVEALSVGLKESKSLATLDLSNLSMWSTKFGPRGAAALASAIAVMASLTSLSLKDNNLGDDGVEVLSVGLKESKSLATLDLSNLSLLSTKFGPRGAAALASAIAVMPSLTSLNLNGNQLCGIYKGMFGCQQGTYDAGGITALSEALKVTASLTNGAQSELQQAQSRGRKGARSSARC